jgi:two-component system nitrogen regulation response regulator GlnG
VILMQMNEMRRILVVDDDPAIAELIEQYFNRSGYEVCTMLEGEKVPETVLRIKPDLILLDLKLPDVNGIEVLKNLKEVDFQAPVVIITGNVSAGTAMEAMKEGAYEYLSKPFSLDELAKLVDKLLIKRMEPEIPNSLGEAQLTSPENYLLLGRSPEIVKIGKMIGQVAQSDAPILITGETGTGKELAARIIHQNSSRKEKSFVSVNCAHLSSDLLEAELFGQSDGLKKNQASGGKLNWCSGGTVFLNEISSMNISLQDKLLRVMKTGMIATWIDKNAKLDVRMIAASKEDLSQQVSQGEFMQELFYHLRVISIRMPPLRERNSDVPLLAEHFLKTYSQQNNKMIVRISADSMKLLMSYPWPGNVGELENNIYSAVVMCKGDQILPEHLPIYFQGNSQVQWSLPNEGDDLSVLFMHTLDPMVNKLFSEQEGKVLDQLVEGLEKALICLALKRCQGNQVKAAELLGISRNTLRERMLRFGLSEKDQTAHTVPSST